MCNNISIIANNASCARRWNRFTVVYPRDRRAIPFPSSLSRIVLLFVIIQLLLLFYTTDIILICAVCVRLRAVRSDKTTNHNTIQYNIIICIYLQRTFNTRHRQRNPTDRSYADFPYLHRKSFFLTRINYGGTYNYIIN